VAYAIGVADPVSVLVDTFGTGTVPDRQLERIVADVFDLTPGGINKALKLTRPIYGPTAAYGHFGRRPRVATVYGKKVQLFPWELTNRVRELQSAARL
jgi:S-adenosylmethionine synthetase